VRLLHAGHLLAAEALLRRDPQADEQAVREALAGVLCRCTGYVKPIEAIRSVAGGSATPSATAGGRP
jgi:4-hydroxybenzoyl-CoA reductase subunit gamma